MKYLVKILLISFLFITASFVVGDTYRFVPNTSFKAGEFFEYKVKFGILPVGEATVEVSPQIYSVNSRACYRVNVFGRTTGLTDIFHVRNTYRSYLDTAAMLPQKFLMSLQENSYKKDQVILFDHSGNSATREQNNEKKSFNLPNNIQDVVSGYYFLRTLDFSRMRVGETVEAPMFFDDEIYKMKVKYNGKGVVKTKFGKIDVIKLTPVLPKNEMFKGEEGIKIWVSDDRNRVPIRIELEFPIGNASMEIKGYKNTRYTFDWR